MNSIFDIFTDILKNKNYPRYDEKELKIFSMFMINRILSFHYEKENKRFSNLMNKYANIYTNFYREELIKIYYENVKKSHKTFVKYLKKEKNNNTEYEEELVKTFKKLYGEEYNNIEAQDMINHLRKLYPDEFFNLCIGSGFDVKYIKRKYKDLSFYIDNLKDNKLTKREIKKYFKISTEEK